MTRIALVTLVLACGHAAPVVVQPRPTPPSDGVFYSQRIDDAGIPILAHRSVSAEGMSAARERLELLLHDAPRLRRNLEQGKYELHILGLAQFPSDLPEQRTKRGTFLENGERFDWHMVGGHLSERTGHFSNCAEATLLPIVGHRLYGDETCIHELAHVIDWFAFDSAARTRVVTEFRASTESGHWRGKYGGTNEHEWFAEVTKYYFRTDHPELASYNPSLVEGRKWLCEYDKRACDFIADVYADRFDPGTPSVSSQAPGAGALEGEVRSREGRVPVRVVVRNHSTQRIHAIWIDYDGKRDMRQPFARQKSAEPGDELAVFTWATHAYVITDDAESALCTIVAPNEEAVIDVTGVCR